MLAGCGTSASNYVPSPAPTYNVTEAVAMAADSVTEFCLSPDTATLELLQAAVLDYVDEAVVTGSDAEVQAACNELVASDPDLAAAIESERQRVAQEAKTAKLLAKYDRWAQEAGGGTLAELYQAMSALEDDIEANAAYELTGSEASVERASCSPGEYSTWYGGEASGWWSCGISFLGGEYDRYSIEVRDGEWAGSADGGAEAEPEVGWVNGVPYEVQTLAGG